jgi:large subunit ribosomal protein L10
LAPETVFYLHPKEVKKLKDISHKEEYVKEIQDKLEKAQIVVLANCEGVTVSEMTELRRNVRQTKSELRVVKNTLVARALHNANMNDLEAHMKGATAVTFGYEDQVAPVKALYDFAQKAKKFTFKAGFMDGKALTVDQLNLLSQIPPRQDLLSMLASAVQGPIRKLACVLDALRTKREEAEGGAAPAAE